jgi:hypothetical protein
MVELGLPSTLAPSTSFYCSEFPKVVKLAGTATIIGMLVVTVTEIRIVK